jgi:tetratricopeptide (TPR) repeat protein
MRLEQYGLAVQVYERAVAFRPDWAELRNNLGTAVKPLLDTTRTTEAFRKAVALSPENIVYRMNLAKALMDALMDEDDAGAVLGELDKAVEIQPDHADAHACRGAMKLRLGKMPEGWDEWEWRLKAAKVLPGHFPGVQWDGADPRGKRLLVHWEQGLGDVIQFARFLPVLIQKGAKIILLCLPKLRRLMSSVKGISQVATLDDGGELSYDARVAVCSLPYLLRTDMDSLPRETPYLWAPQEDCDHWRERLAGDRNFRVGLVWATAVNASARTPKSIPAQTVAGLLDVLGVTFYSLFVGASPGDLATLGDRIIDLSLELKDFAVTAAVMKQMDLVITIDTAAAHLAGAIGSPVWILLPRVADWRWLRNRSDSPWYPTARLFRQPAPGDWESVVSQVRRELMDRRGSLDPS